MALVYQHRRLDNGSVFYIGIGTCKRRVNSKASRNKYWHNIVSKFGYKSEIIVDGISIEEAKSLECYLIGLYGRSDIGTGVLANMTDGGDGLFGFNHTEQSRRKMSLSRVGEKNSMYGLKGPLNALFKRPRPKCVVDKIAQKNNGKKRSKEFSNRLSERQFKPVIDTVSGKVYPSSKHVIELVGINYHTFRGMLNGNKKNTTQYLYLTDYEKLVF